MNNSQFDTSASRQQSVAVKLSECVAVLENSSKAHLLLSIPPPLLINAIRPILYMWSAILSGPSTFFLTQPVRLVFCRHRAAELSADISMTELA